MFGQTTYPVKVNTKRDSFPCTLNMYLKILLHNELISGTSTEKNVSSLVYCCTFISPDALILNLEFTFC